ncbi:Pimeloyl-ACP methyl ester carboxylesterase [Flaviramulus basaltis]|uniref:Pimeloyl-ACP methyl ester carboxylesterase n=1 Tax=Flaviramulus basaltis TaxID=369401 RepID=A0A1K2I9W3_9FLAO|nr:alpha/beta hydrolase [Flaviramulus basaltis]SFZ89212.1 Pimeloyl-ACP methyl ester carboxylesterase [Flaviramulus basaltis]
MNQNLLKRIGFLLNLISQFSSKLAAKLAILLFSKPQKGRLKGTDSPFLKSATQEVLKYEDISIMTYHWKGTKDTILLTHGWESNSYRWKDLIKILKKLDYNIISIDAPAHGNSGSKIFNALLYSECINVVAKKFNANVIIGHSVGGMASVFCQHKYQLPSIKKLVLLGAPSNFTGIFDRYSKMMGYNKKVLNAMNQYVLKKFNHLPEYFSAARFSNEISSKGLIIHDKKDRIIPYNDALDFKNHYSNAKLISTKGFGHGLKSEKVYNHILEFLND